MNSDVNITAENELGTRKTVQAKKRKQAKPEWLVPVGLILLSLVPVIAGAARIVELSSGAEITTNNARFFASPIPVVAHIIGVTLYSMLGAIQFVPSLRNRKVGWHRNAGRLLIPSGLVAALSGLWMTQFYPWPEYDGIWLYGLRLIFGLAMLFSLILGYIAARQKDFKRHSHWMIRAYAIGLGAGTQVFTHIPVLLFPSIAGELARTIMMGAGWVINLAVAEWVIRKSLDRPSIRL
jgi:putative Mn2+ efflux pump MntP